MNLSTSSYNESIRENLLDETSPIDVLEFSSGKLHNTHDKFYKATAINISDCTGHGIESYDKERLHLNQPGGHAHSTLTDITPSPRP